MNKNSTKNKLSTNFTEGMLRKKHYTIIQKGMQIWLLLRMFPFLVSGKVDTEDEYVGLVLYLLRIMQLVFAPKVMDSQIPYLRALVKDFLWCSKDCFQKWILWTSFIIWIIMLIAYYGDVKLHRCHALSGSTDLAQNTLSRDDLCGLGYVDTD